MTTPLTNSSAFSQVSNQVPMENYSLNQRYLAYARSCQSDQFVRQDQTQYYNDPEKIKKKKIKRGAILATSALVVGTIAATFIGSRAGNKNITELLNKGWTTAEGFLGKTGNFLSNINNVKDDLLERAGDTLKKKDIPILKHLSDYCDGTKKFYRSILKKSPLGATYKQTAEILQKEGIQVKDFDSWFNELNDNVLDTLKTGNNGEHFTRGIFKKGLFGKMTNSNIADDVLIKNSKFKELAGNIVIPEGKVLSEEAQKALENLNKSRNKITAKLRDINAGSAATDFITDAVSVLSLGVAVKMADTKEEKKSIALDIGLPFLSALGCAFIGNLMAIAGAPCMIFGFAMGQVAKMAAKGLTNTDKKETMQA